MNCFNLVRVFTQFNFLQTEMFQRIFGFVKSYAKLLMPEYKTAAISEGIFMTSQRFAYYKCLVIHSLSFQKCTRQIAYFTHFLVMSNDGTKCPLSSILSIGTPTNTDDIVFNVGEGL